MGARVSREALRYGAEIFHALKKLLAERGLSSRVVGDEGGHAPNLESCEAATSVILEAIAKAGYKAGKDVYLGLDVASSEFFKDGSYELAAEKRRFLGSRAPLRYLADLTAKFPIITIEDGMSEADWDGWAQLTMALGGKIQLVGDDVFVTNTGIFKEAIERHIANAILIKPNQIGTPTETLAAIDMADKAHYAAVVSHSPGRPRMRRLPTSPSPAPPPRSRPARCRVLTAWPSTTNCCASRPSSATCATPDARHSPSSSEPEGLRAPGAAPRGPR